MTKRRLNTKNHGKQAGGKGVTFSTKSYTDAMTRGVPCEKDVLVLVLKWGNGEATTVLEQYNAPRRLKQRGGEGGL